MTHEMYNNGQKEGLIDGIDLDAGEARETG
jgi:hypothetical protein